MELTVFKVELSSFLKKLLEIHFESYMNVPDADGWTTVLGLTRLPQLMRVVVRNVLLQWNGMDGHWVHLVED